MSTDIDTWLTDKSNSIFKEQKNGSEISIKTNTQYKALLYALIHESTHVLDFDYQLTPYINETLKNLAKNKQNVTPFSQLSWEEAYKPLNKYKFKNSDKLNFYGMYNKRQLLDNTKTETYFYLLKETPFVSIYSTSNWQDDLADAFTYYHLEKALGANIELALYKEEKKIDQFYPTQQKVFKEKAIFLQTLYK